MFSPGDARVERGRRADVARAGLNKIQPRPGLTRSPAPSCRDPRGLSLLPAQSAGAHQRDPCPGVPPSEARPGGTVDTDLDTLATALFVKTDDLPKSSPQLAPWRPTVGITPQLSDAELVSLAMMQAILGFTAEARWLRHARAHLRHLFPYLPKQFSYNKRLRKPPNSSVRSHASWPQTRHCGPTMYGWWTPHRSNAAVPGRRPSGPTWPDGLSTATAPVIRATSGACGCTWCARWAGCRSPSP